MTNIFQRGSNHQPGGVRVHEAKHLMEVYWKYGIQRDATDCLRVVGDSHRSFPKDSGIVNQPFGGFHQWGVAQHGKKWMVFVRENPILDDFGVPPFQEIPIWMMKNNGKVDSTSDSMLASF